MPPRTPLSTNLLQCSKCSYSLAFRPFHNTARRASDEPKLNPSCREREAAREIQNKSIDDLPKGIVRNVHYAPRSQASAQQGQVSRVRHSPSQFDRSATPSSMGRPTSEINNQRTALPAAPARGGRPPMRKNNASARPQKPGGPNNRSRGKRKERPAAPTMDEEEDIAAEIQKIEDEDETAMGRLIEEHEEAFAMPEEAYNYAQVKELLTACKEHQSRHDSLTAYEASPRAFGGMLSDKKVADVKRSLDKQENKQNELIKQALEAIVKTEAKYLPYYAPTDSPPTPVLEKGQVGATPIGKGGMGKMTEDALRLLAGRPTMEWNDPKTLAQKLLDGEFVKFRNPLEKNSVTRLAEEMQWQPGQTYKSEHVGFSEPDADTKRTIVETTVKGDYQDPNDEQVKSEFLKNVARLAQFNGTYKATDKQMLLETLKGMMPKQRAPSGA